MTQKQIEDVLRSVMHPVREADIVTLGMVEDIKIEEGKIRFKLVFPSPDALSGSIKQSCEAARKNAFPLPVPLLHNGKDIIAPSGKF